MNAHIVLLLISADFIASDFCYEKEMKIALERHERGQARVIPIILNSCDWKIAPFSKIQGLPRNGKAVNSDSWKNPEDAFHHIAEEVRKIVIDFKDKKVQVAKEVEEKLGKRQAEIIEISKVLENKKKELSTITEELGSITKLNDDIHKVNLHNKNLEDKLSNTILKNNALNAEIYRRNINIEKLKREIKHQEEQYSLSRQEIANINIENRNSIFKFKKLTAIAVGSLLLIATMFILYYSHPNQKRKRILKLQRDIYAEKEAIDEKLRITNFDYFNFDSENGKMIGDYSKRFLEEEIISLGVNIEYESFCNEQSKDSIYFMVHNDDNKLISKNGGKFLSKDSNRFTSMHYFEICGDYCKKTVIFEIVGSLKKGTYCVQTIYKNEIVDDVKIKIK